jgi:hypothetical protein
MFIFSATMPSGREYKQGWPCYTEYRQVHLQRYCLQVERVQAELSLLDREQTGSSQPLLPSGRESSRRDIPVRQSTDRFIFSATAFR